MRACARWRPTSMRILESSVSIDRLQLILFSFFTGIAIRFSVVRERAPSAGESDYTCDFIGHSIPSSWIVFVAFLSMLSTCSSWTVVCFLFKYTYIYMPVSLHSRTKSFLRAKNEMYRQKMCWTCNLTVRMKRKQHTDWRRWRVAEAVCHPTSRSRFVMSKFDLLAALANSKTNCRVCSTSSIPRGSGMQLFYAKYDKTNQWLRRPTTWSALHAYFVFTQQTHGLSMILYILVRPQMGYAI